MFQELRKAEQEGWLHGGCPTPTRHWDAVQFRVFLILFSVCHGGTEPHRHNQTQCRNGGSVTSSCRVSQPVRRSFSSATEGIVMSHTAYCSGEPPKVVTTLSQEATFLKTRSHSLLPERWARPRSALLLL